MFVNRSVLALAIVVAQVILGNAGMAEESPVVGEGCDPVIDLTDPTAMAALINSVGLGEFQNPPEVNPVSEATRLELQVDYATIKVAGCTAHLRTYNGSIVGPTIRAKPGDTLHIRLINKLPHVVHPHPQQPPPAEHASHFSFNLTNLHTHGLHVAPQGPGPVDPNTGRVPFESDNVLLELAPGEFQDYRIEIPQNHPAGTFWYHAHIHGATAVQVSSGMAGALIVEGSVAKNGDLDVVPVVGAAKGREKIFVLQQIRAGKDGQIEGLPRTLRPTLVNGQLVPIIRMRPGEIQRWRFIHAGVQENIALAMDEHTLYEVAADGISLGRAVPWPEAPKSGISPDLALIIGPGYRTDVLVQATNHVEPGKRYFLRDLKLDPSLSIQAADRALQRAELVEPEIAVAPIDPNDTTPGQILAEIVIDGEPVTVELPNADILAPVVPESLPTITDAELAATKAIDPDVDQEVHFSIERRVCDPSTGICRACVDGDGSACKTQFLVNGNSYSSKIKTTLHLRTGKNWTAAEWHVSGASAPHPFHIHVNPFQVERLEPGSNAPIRIWKDTILTMLPHVLRARYTEFAGQFVMHCHILDHEDRGMMKLVEIVE